jgi:ElaA protein
MIHWSVKKFDVLNPAELYAILRLRTEIFVVEQNCVFQDMDNKDQLCRHLMAWQAVPGQDRELVAYTRLVPPGVSYEEFPSIGRVVTAAAFRSSGIGKLLMEKSIEELAILYGATPIRIGAQLYLKKFYESFGFVQSSEVYDEDGIDHLEMTRP